MKLFVLGRSIQFNEDSAAVAGIDLGNGVAAVLMITATANKTTVTAQGAAAGSQQLLAANAAAGGRKAAIVANNGSTNLHVAWDQGTVNAAGEATVAPGNSWDAPEVYQGAVFGWWEGASPTGSAVVTEIV